MPQHASEQFIHIVWHAAFLTCGTVLTVQGMGSDMCTLKWRRTCCSDLAHATMQHQHQPAGLQPAEHQAHQQRTSGMGLAMATTGCAGVAGLSGDTLPYQPLAAGAPPAGGAAGPAVEPQADALGAVGGVRTGPAVEPHTRVPVGGGAGLWTAVLAPQPEAPMCTGMDIWCPAAPMDGLGGPACAAKLWVWGMAGPSGTALWRMIREISPAGCRSGSTTLMVTCLLVSMSGWGKEEGG